MQLRWTELQCVFVLIVILVFVVLLVITLGQGGEVAARPGVVPEGEEGPELDERVEVGEEDIGGEEPDILGIGREVPEDFDGLGEDDPSEESGEGIGGLRGVGVPGSLGEEIDQGGIGEERKVGEAGQVDGIDAVWLSGPDGAFCEERGRIRTPRRTYPSTTLTEELGVDRLADANGGLNLGLLGVLDLDLPTVLNQVAGDVVVIVRVKRSEKAEEEHLVEVSLLEGLVLENAGADAHRTAGNNEDTAVNRVCRADLKVVTIEIEASEHVPEATPDGKTLEATNSFVGTDNAD